LSDLQDTMYAQSIWSSDLFTGMDTSGKTVWSEVFKDFNSCGLVHSLKHLTERARTWLY
jgi:hypothetical protein